MRTWKLLLESITIFHVFSYLSAGIRPRGVLPETLGSFRLDYMASTIFEFQTSALALHVGFMQRV